MKKLIIILIAGIIFINYFHGKVARSYENVAAPQRSITTSALPESGDGKEFCGLDSVVCEGESAVVNAYITAYSEIDSCHYKGCPMANGEKAHIGAVACPRRYSLGTKVQIDGVDYICKDRTAQYVDGRWDIFMGYGPESYAKAIKFGKRYKEVTIYAGIINK